MKQQCPVLMWRRFTWFRGPCKCLVECDENCRWLIQGELGGNILLSFFPCRSLSHWPFVNDIGPLYSIMLIAMILSFRLFPSAPEIYPFCTCENRDFNFSQHGDYLVNADLDLTWLVIVLRENNFREVQTEETRKTV
jgi:hypothetical protein